MRRVSTRFALVYVAVVVGLTVATAPALAAPIDDAKAYIWNQVEAAEASNQNVLNTFTVDALQASTVPQLDAARSRAHSSLDSIWYNYLGRIDAKVAEFPELTDSALSAKAQLLTDHDSAHAEVNYLYQEVLTSLPPTTTTTTTTRPPTTTTTTTTKPPTTTTTTVPRTTTTTVDRTTTTTVPDTTTTTTTAVPEATTTTTTVAESTTTTEAVIAPPPADDSGPPPPDDPVGSTEDPANASLPGTGSESTTQAMELRMEDARKDLGMVSSVLSTGAAVVLPPGIVQAAVAPVIVLEVLFTTVVGSIQSMAAPLLALLAAVLYFVWRETRRATSEEAAT